MGVLVLQIIIKQWDKSQRTPAHVLQRNALANQQPIRCPPAVYVLDQCCIVDQQGDDIQGNRVKTPKILEGILCFDRFKIRLADQSLVYWGNSTELPVLLGALTEQWIQCKYTDRYSIFAADQYYWLYEKIILNAIWLNTFDENVFLNTQPTRIYEDFRCFNP